MPEDANPIPATLRRPGAVRFWCAVILIGIATGISAILLTRLLEIVQHFFWGGSGTTLLSSVETTPPARRVLILLAAGFLTGALQFILGKLPSGNGIDTTAAIWFHAGRLPALRTLLSAVLSVVIVGMGASLGREGAPKQAGAVFANFFSDRFRLSDEQRRLLVSCGAGAGMGAAYGVPLGGALFSLEVMRGVLALRYVLPALFTSLIATAVSWLVLPDAPTYVIPAFSSSAPVLLWALLAGPVAGLVSVAYVRLIAWAYRNRPSERTQSKWSWRNFAAPVLGLGLLGVLSVWFPQLLGNGKDISSLLFTGPAALVLLSALFFLKPAVTALCVSSGAPGGLFTPSLTVGALLGALLGSLTAPLLPGTPPGLFALLGAGAVLAATTQGPISSVVLLMELTGRDRSFILPLLLAAGSATLVARTVELRSIYDAHLSEVEIEKRRQLREQASQPALS